MELNILNEAIGAVKAQVMDAIRHNETDIIYAGNSYTDMSIKDAPDISEIEVNNDGRLVIRLIFDKSMSGAEKDEVKEWHKASRLRDVDAQIAKLQSEREQILAKMSEK